MPASLYKQRYEASQNYVFNVSNHFPVSRGLIDLMPSGAKFNYLCKGLTISI